MMVPKILLLCILQAFVAEITPLHDCHGSKVSCLCGERPNEEITYFEIDLEASGATGKDCQELSYEVCASHSCSYSFSPLVKVDKEVEYEQTDNSMHPVSVVFPPLDEEAKEYQSKSRYRRFPKNCNDSITPVSHAIIECVAWPNFMTCQINCTHGYAMEEEGKVVLKTTRKCRESEAFWSPKETFPICKPYINCRVILTKPGNLECKTSGPIISYCDISCDADYENDEIPKKRYDCIDEKYAETLPHCASIAKDVALIKRPIL